MQGLCEQAFMPTDRLPKASAQASSHPPVHRNLPALALEQAVGVAQVLWAQPGGLGRAGWRRLGATCLRPAINGHALGACRGRAERCMGRSSKEAWKLAVEQMCPAPASLLQCGTLPKQHNIKLVHLGFEISPTSSPPLMDAELLGVASPKTSYFS